jgi:diadenylate cyclase
VASFVETLSLHWRIALEILMISVGVYFLVRRFGSANWARFLIIVGTLCLVLLLVSYWLDLIVIRWLVIAGAFFFSLALIVSYQPELRRTLADLGNRGFLFFSEGKNRDFPDHLADAVRQLGAKRFGALFAIERGIELKPHLETGVSLDAIFSTELILTLFHPKTALHDGGIILREGRVVGAGCLFPVSQREISDRSVGLRHRAGLGITEESDAVAIIVSEETGHISLAYNGELERDLEPEEFRKRLLEVLEIEIADEEDEHHPSASDPPKPKKSKGKKRKPAPSESGLLSG